MLYAPTPSDQDHSTKQIQDDDGLTQTSFITHFFGHVRSTLKSFQKLNPSKQ